MIHVNHLVYTNAQYRLAIGVYMNKPVSLGISIA